MYRAFRRQPPVAQPDPADELKAKLAEARAAGDDRDAFEAGETPVDEADVISILPAVDAYTECRSDKRGTTSVSPLRTARFSALETSPSMEHPASSSSVLRGRQIFTSSF